MEHVAVDDLEPANSGNTAQRSLSAPLGVSNLAINHYRLDPGERTAGLHAHERQTEVFVVLAGRATFETLTTTVEVEAGDAVSFAPGEHKSGLNQTDDPVEILAIGAPPDGGDVFVPLECPACGHPECRLAIDDGAERLVCRECGHARSPACPVCGGTALRAVLDADRGRPVSACLECGERFEA